MVLIKKLAMDMTRDLLYIESTILPFDNIVTISEAFTYRGGCIRL
jgi:hypothetical protein